MNDKADICRSADAGLHDMMEIGLSAVKRTCSFYIIYKKKHVLFIAIFFSISYFILQQSVSADRPASHLLNLYSDLSSVFKLDIRSTENLPSLWQQPRASLLSMSQQLRVYTTSQKNASVFFTFFDIFLYLIPYNFLLDLGLYVETKKNQLVGTLLALLYRNITE